ncbi:MAG: hypothetical protein WD010_09690 [Nitriliruptor sp.]|uniref:hypothetical protein n=1 Tax=Nitriliruptor sp. TaxID=2448056 RepID=UPI00349FEB9F
MTTDVAASAASEAIRVPRAAHRRRGLVLLAAAVFNVWVWATRARNLIADAGDFSAAFVGVHAVLYLSATAVALVVGVIGWRQWREARTPDPHASSA